MAKWGEGDPRWIVEERPDATNVNNWHWTEKNADQWSKKKLEELFAGFEVVDEAQGVKITIEELEKCEGEARANNRKAKLIFFYEWELVFKWRGRETKGKSDDEVSGKLTVPNLSEEHTDLNDVDIEVTLTSSSTAAAEKIKNVLRKGIGAAQIRSQLGKYVEALKSEFSEGLILPAATVNDKKTAPQVNPPAAKACAPSSSTSSALKNLDLGGPLSLSTITMEERFKCTGQELFNVLTQPEMLQVFTGSAVGLMKEAKSGERFELLNGNILGEFVSVTPFTKITQKWRLKSWRPEDHFSTVEFVISQGKEDTTMKLEQKNVPAKEVESTRMGWSRYYFDAIKRSFGFGSGLV